MSDTDKITIQFSDIKAVVSIIDIVSERGAFKGQELTIVGALRDKLAKYIIQEAPPEPKEETHEEA